MAGTRKYKRVYRYAKQKWSPLIKTGNLGLNNQTDIRFVDIVTNSTDAATPTPTVVKVKHVRLELNVYESVDGAAQFVDGVIFGAVYIPEGITVNSIASLEALVVSHPEWIMCYGIADAGKNSAPRTLTSGVLSRNLNSGDTIKMFYYCNGGNIINNLICRYVARCVCRAN